MTEENGALTWWVDKGSEFLGLVVAGPIGAHSDPTVGTAAGFAIDEALRKVGQEIRKWKLGPREERRTGFSWSSTER